MTYHPSLHFLKKNGEIFYIWTGPTYLHLEYVYFLHSNIHEINCCNLSFIVDSSL